MEPVGSIVGAVPKVASAIAKAVKTARRNKTRCRELAQRVKEVDDILREYKKVAMGDAAATTRKILGRLKDALDDALKLVESCGRSRDGLLFRLHRFVASDGLAAKLDDVNSRINNCLIALQAVNVAHLQKKMDRHLAVAAGGGDHRRTNNPREINAGKSGNKGNKGGQQHKQNGGKGGKRRKGKKAAGPPPQPQPCTPTGAVFPYYLVHSMEEDPTSCSVM
ncbi:uncharacterized protein [Oryza sativa Japonica Group]|jgi:hypothetical protein|uniref:Expressed protein n=3 Tax=Oryza TaxID=4527 RepID=Q2QZY8_ORYSJ|nr:uncharacterized protein LOC4351076 [Oryza sativa Japonica Group]KAB8116063.1 hypothetical protein EE612_057015 [Oryza sativa]ABA95151.1 expressed protein [Oryza sativa Japonica Group]EAZ19216.1 hypothetical protein OsJ_34755 [Oryza sativa Japonica Group]KAF2912022.1 hypothetical protein DAI22_11g224700 [Oryza sativa Japonica Group]BAT15166.1 Os11g0665600 [Oryza sativa Japonica Group]